jgi:hypothetical protein
MFLGKKTAATIPPEWLAEAKYFGPFGFVRIYPGETIRYGQAGKDIAQLYSYFITQAIACDTSPWVAGPATVQTSTTHSRQATRGRRQKGIAGFYSSLK